MHVERAPSQESLTLGPTVRHADGRGGHIARSRQLQAHSRLQAGSHACLQYGRPQAARGCALHIAKHTLLQSSSCLDLYLTRMCVVRRCMQCMQGAHRPVPALHPVWGRAGAHSYPKQRHGPMHPAAQALWCICLPCWRPQHQMQLQCSPGAGRRSLRSSTPACNAACCQYVQYPIMRVPALHWTTRCRRQSWCSPEWRGSLSQAHVLSSSVMWVLYLIGGHDVRRLLFNVKLPGQV